jgi:hypothetical protein
LLPPSNETPRLRYLQEVLDAADPRVAFGEWPKLTEDDYLAIGRLVMLCNFVELNLRRIVEAWEEAGKLTVPIKGNACDLRIEGVEAAVQEMFPWPENELNGLKRLVEIRWLRNMVAHFAARRFPDDDAFLFTARSERDFKRQFGRPSEPNQWLTAILDGHVVPSAVDHIDSLQRWLADQTSLTVKQAYKIRTGTFIPKSE